MVHAAICMDEMESHAVQESLKFIRATIWLEGLFAIWQANSGFHDVTMTS